ncbi:LacI family DNA-binding transcriptional regulator [Gynuella sp.]|uniref:LacI family DNA-binding transcriptional regulator n=1 Tax=Gynuella sp. TaxID=2969146 RepID=UPI003D134E25
MARELPKRPTLKAVAARAGVSLATVDRVLNQRSNVNQHTRERVLMAMAELSGNTDHVPAVPFSRAEKTLHYGFVMESSIAFIQSIQTAIDQTESSLAGLNVRLHSYTMPPIFNLPGFLQLLRQAAAENDGLILVCREDPSIAACVNQIISEGIPIVCLTNDLSDIAHLGYAGVNHVSAGRTAGHFMGHYIGDREGEIVLVVSAPFRSQYERELGFRRILREEFPNLTIRESLNNCDRDEESYQNLSKLFHSGVKPLGVYNLAGGNVGVAKAIEEAGWTSDIVFIGHELNADSYALLANQQAHVIIDQDLHMETMTAVCTLLHHHGVVHQAPSLVPTTPIITIRENIGMQPQPGNTPLFFRM